MIDSSAFFAVEQGSTSACSGCWASATVEIWTRPSSSALLLDCSEVTTSLSCRPLQWRLSAVPSPQCHSFCSSNRTQFHCESPRKPTFFTNREPLWKHHGLLMVPCGQDVTRMASWMATRSFSSILSNSSMHTCGRIRTATLSNSKTFLDSDLSTLACLKANASHFSRELLILTRVQCKRILVLSGQRLLLYIYEFSESKAKGGTRPLSARTMAPPAARKWLQMTVPGLWVYNHEYGRLVRGCHTDDHCNRCW